MAVISECLYPPLPRFDYKASGAPKPFLDAWAKMDLTHIYGFPLWEEAVFSQLSTHFTEVSPPPRTNRASSPSSLSPCLLPPPHTFPIWQVSAIFTHYAKSGSAGAVSANAALTMQVR